VNCLEFRRALGADPNHAGAESLAHRSACAACEKYAQEMLRLNGLIKRALEIPVPTKREIAITAPRANWYAMAASVLLVLGATIGTLWFLGYPRQSLAAAVVNHLAGEPAAMTATQSRVSAQLLDGVLRAKGLHLVKPMDAVSYLQSCEIRGHIVPHLVVQTDRGPVTVLLLTEEKIAAIQRFDEQQYHGILVPMTHGAMAVIATDASIVESVAAQVKAAVSE
jgi:hypothetical protein